MVLKRQPSGQSRKRYLLIAGGTSAEIEQAIREGIGTLGWARAAPLFVQTSLPCIIAVERAMLEDVKATLALSPNPFKLLRVSGTLKGLGKKM